MQGLLHDIIFAAFLVELSVTFTHSLIPGPGDEATPHNKFGQVNNIIERVSGQIGVLYLE